MASDPRPIRRWILALFVLPAVVMVYKLADLPGATEVGDAFSLASLPVEFHARLRYVLFVPLGAIVVVLFRVFLGIRVLGPFRSILLAIAFQITGVTLGLFFMALVVGVVAGVRPLLRAQRVPYFGRVSVTVSLVAATMMLAVVISQSLGIQTLQRVVYFPIVALCLTGEGFAATLRREGPRSALWRGGMTALAALLITAVSKLPGLGETLIRFPELLLLQIGAILGISEFLGFRLFEALNPVPDRGRRRRPAPGVRSEEPARMKIAVVRNRKNVGVLARLGLPSPERYGRRSVQSVLDALRDGGHSARAVEGDIHLLRRLDKMTGAGSDGEGLALMVFNMSYGIQGENRYAHVPLMLEMAGVAYTGADPTGHMISLDKAMSKTLMENSGIPTPAFRVLRRPDDPVDGLRFPLVVKPCHESTSNGLTLVEDRRELAEAVDRVITRYRQKALVEEYVEGRELTVSLLGNDPVEILPIVELEFGDRSTRLFLRADKFHRTEDEPQKICPAALREDVARRVRDVALRVYRTCQCRDYARVDIRLAADGTPYVLEINSMAALGRGGAYVLSAKVAGYGFSELVCRIVDVAHERYVGRVAPRMRPAAEIIQLPQSGPGTGARSGPAAGQAPARLAAGGSVRMPAARRTDGQD